MAENFFEKNMAALEKRGIRIRSRLERHAGTRDVVVEQSRKGGLPVVKVRSGAEFVYLHSIFDPVKEAERFIQTIEDIADARAVVMYGLGLGYHVEKTFEKHPQIENVILVECNFEILRRVFEARDMSHILGDARITFIFEDTEKVNELLSAQLNSESWVSKKSAVIVHKPSLGVAPRQCLDIKNAFEYIWARRSAAERRPMEDQCSRNVAENAMLSPPSRGVSVFKGKFDGMPVFVAGAGPSLDFNAYLLRHVRENALIVAVDSAVSPLMKYGCPPHFAVTLDPQKNVLRYFDSAAGYEGMLVHALESCPEAVARFDAPRRFATVAEEQLEGLRPLGYAEGDALEKAASVFIMALDFAVSTGASPVVLIGSDLAVSKNATHSRFSKGGLGSDWSTMRTVEGFLEPEVRTPMSLFIYLDHVKNYIAEHSGVRIINATEGGAFIPGAGRASMREIIFNNRNWTGGVNARINGALDMKTV